MLGALRTLGVCFGGMIRARCDSSLYSGDLGHVWHLFYNHGTRFEVSNFGCLDMLDCEQLTGVRLERGL